MTATASRHPTLTRLVVGAAVIASAALGFQALHLVEHLLQLGYWFAHPTEAPWMTPWAMAGVHLLTVGTNHATGVELLHLIGNGIFLVGLGALAFVCRTAGRSLRSQRNLRIAVYLQGAHLVEHIALTATVLLAGKAIGLSTFLGLVDGPVLTSWRVWFHLLINLTASVYTMAAMRDLRGAGLLAAIRQVRPA